MPQTLSFDEEPIYEAYSDVRSDKTETTWLALKYENNNHIVLAGTGTSFDETMDHYQDDGRVYVYAKFITGDELSKRSKFALITWIGQEIGALKKAKMSTDKSLVKNVLRDFAIEISADDRNDISSDEIENLIRKAGGANYGTGERN